MLITTNEIPIKYKFQGKINLLWFLFRIFAPDGYTEFLHIAIPADAPTRSLSERGLRNGSLSVVGILHRRSAARICAAEVLCQLSFA